MRTCRERPRRSTIHMATAEYRRRHATQTGATRGARISKKGEEVSKCLGEYVECVKYVMPVNYVECVSSPTQLHDTTPRQPNLKPPNNLRFVSPKTHNATQRPTRQKGGARKWPATASDYFRHFSQVHGSSHVLHVGAWQRMQWPLQQPSQQRWGSNPHSAARAA